MLGEADLNDVTRDLEALKLRLARMDAEDIPESQASALGAEISAIRLHLKRLTHDREAVARFLAERAEP